MAMYKARVTVFKDPAGKTLKGPTALYLVGDVCSAFGLIGVLSVILCFMEERGSGMLAGSIIMAVAGFALCVVLHKKAKQDAERACLEALAQMGAGEDQARK